MPIFERPEDYELFEQVLAQAHERVAMRTVSYCVMPNHWHLVLWPRKDEDLSAFMRWLTLTHTQRWHSAKGTAGAGHLYQGRFKSFPIQSDGHYLTACRYVERNALQAGLVSRAEDWRWCKEKGVRYFFAWPLRYVLVADLEKSRRVGRKSAEKVPDPFFPRGRPRKEQKGGKKKRRKST